MKNPANPPMIKPKPSKAYKKSYNPYMTLAVADTFSNAFVAPVAVLLCIVAAVAVNKITPTTITTIDTIIFSNTILFFTPVNFKGKSKK